MDSKENAEVVASAVTVLADRWELAPTAAAAALFDVAEEIGVELNDLAGLVVSAATARGRLLKSSLAR